MITALAVAAGPDTEIHERYHFFYRSPLGQWNKSSFAVDAMAFCCAEQFMMYQKAVLFDDVKTASDIMTTLIPKEHQTLGRKVIGFDSQIWSTMKFDIVCWGNLAKFSQNRKLRALLLSTENRILVEASPTDCIWGIGIGEDNPDRFDESKWRGKNLLGKALMKIRLLLANDSTEYSKLSEIKKRCYIADCESAKYMQSV